MSINNPANNGPQSLKFGVYSLSYKFFEGMKPVKIYSFLDRCGWNKGYLICIKERKEGGECRFHELIREKCSNDEALYREILQLYTQCRYVSNDENIKDIEQEINEIQDFKKRPSDFLKQSLRYKDSWDKLFLPMLAPWFQKASSIEFYDPHFAQHRESENEIDWYDPFNQILRKIVDRPYYSNGTSGNMSKIVVDIKYYCVFDKKSNERSKFESDCKSHLKIPPHCKFEFNLCEKSKVMSDRAHDRAIIITFPNKQGVTYYCPTPTMVSFSAGLDDRKSLTLVSFEDRGFDDFRTPYQVYHSFSIPAGNGTP